MSKPNELPRVNAWADVDVGCLLGHALASVKECGDGLRFELACGAVFTMEHRQDCCEDVVLDDVAGELTDLVGAPLTMAEMISGEAPAPPEGGYQPDSETWTFYKFATVRGYVTLRWHGTSNGYYSESVSFWRVA